MTRIHPLLVTTLLLAAGCPQKSASQDAADAADAPETPANKAAPVAAKPAAPKPPPATAQRLGPPEKNARDFVPGEGRLFAVLHTSMGRIVAELHEDAAPLTVASFVGLATGQHPFRAHDGQMKTAKFFDGTIFHRIIPRFMVQGGDPTGTGRSGPGYRFKNENATARFDSPGRLAMANSGRDTNGSQFFLTEVATPHLDGGYTIFGQVLSGLDVVVEMGRVRTGPGNRPLEPPVLERVEIVRAPEPPQK